ncbi:hypothetical protein DEA8626_01171 [Defluviimonas aquaemixtae]|uniref:Anti-sigma K factor RskA C-terminal domain-containing protein n=1 Tax=Albidovulum aquaemixtae TaxID=1542388 RepID=A0A2R8B4W3_9RHOB|nr:anti-sigma factor [Defluviimonas aquaemixtae]SPH17647.1 hypothetical protein DEA8626_01171 [Defluviimonas aquaemixtae]
MTERNGHMPEREALAAEYVLGTLSFAERLTAEALIESDVNFAQSVESWQERLSPLNEDYAEIVPPQGLDKRIEARLFPKAPPARKVGWLWGLLAGAAVAVAAFFVFVPPQAPPATVTATLTGEGQELVVAANYDPDQGELTVSRTAGPAAGEDQDYELWVIPEGETPISLGLLREETLRVPLDTLPAGATLAITLERAGGSPTGAPEGELIAAAVIGDQ